MKLIILLSFLFSFSITSAYSQQTEIVHFDYDMSNLTGVSKAKLDRAVYKFRDKEISSVKIIGHTDSDGSEDYNIRLSKRRATAVSKYLNQRGVLKDKISVIHKGENQPVATNQDDEGKQSNRRVEVEITYDYTVPKQFQASEKCFVLDPEKANTIRIDDKGTKLHIPKNSFVDVNDQLITDDVTLCYKVFNNAADMAFSQIPMTYTLGNDEYNFNSSGMFELTGSVNETPVYINKTKEIKIDYALARQNPDISFFKLNDNKENWVKIQEIQKLAENMDKEIEVDQFEVNKYALATIAVPRTEDGGALFMADAEFVNEAYNLNGAIGNDQKQLEVLNVKNVVQKKRNVRKKMGTQGTLLAPGVDIGHTYPDIIRGLNVSSFGVYNCDQIYRLPNLVTLQASYVDENGQPLKDLHVLSMMDLNYNGAFSFSPERFSCDAKGDNVLALFTKKGEIYLLDRGEFAKMNINASGKQVFKMKNMSKTIKSTKDLAKHLGM